MSTLGDLKLAVAAFLQVEHEAVDNHQGSPSDQGQFDTLFNTLFYQAATRARRFALRRHNFSECVSSVQVVMPSGTNFISLPSVDVDRVGYVVKAVQVLSCCQSDWTCPVRIDMMSYKELMDRKRRLQRGGRNTEEALLRATGVLRGSDLYIMPRGDEDLYLEMDVVLARDNYTAADDAEVDFFTDQLSDYMLWACIVELNHLNSRFVSRQEGSLEPPTKLRDTALESAIVDDVYDTEGYLTHNM